MRAEAEQVPAPWLHPQQRPGHTQTHAGFSPGLRGLGQVGYLAPLSPATPAMGPGCPHHPVTMVSIQLFIPEGKNVSRKETKTEKGNSLELSV